MGLNGLEGKLWPDREPEGSIPYNLEPAAMNLLLLIQLHIHSFNEAFFIVS